MLAQPHRFVLKNGLRLILTPNPTVDLVTARFLLKAGSQWEKPEQAGLSSLLSAVLTKGTLHRSSLAIAETVEYLGAGLGTNTGTDFFALNIKSITPDFPELLRLAAELLREPSFPEKEVNLERSMALQGIQSQQESPLALAYDQLQAHLYGNHPYGYSTLGKTETVRALKSEDLHSFHQRYFRPDNVVLSIAGRIDLEDCFALVEQTFSDWGAPPDDLELQEPAIEASDARVLFTEKDTHQTMVILGYLASNIHSPNYIPLKLISSYLGNGMSSRLFTELREKQGLAYDVSAMFPTRLAPALFSVYIGTAPHNLAIAREGLQREVDRLREVRLEEETLQGAKNKLLGQYALGKQTNGRLAQIYAWYELMGVGIDFDQTFPQSIQRVTSEEIMTVAQQYFQKPCTSVVGPVAPSSVDCADLKTEVGSL